MNVCPLCDEPIDELAGDDKMLYMGEECHVSCVEEVMSEESYEKEKNKEILKEKSVKSK